MKKKRGITQLITLLLLGSIAFNNVIFQRYPNPKKIATSSYEVRVELQNRSSGLDVGKAD